MNAHASCGRCGELFPKAPRGRPARWCAACAPLVRSDRAAARRAPTTRRQFRSAFTADFCVDCSKPFGSHRPSATRCDSCETTAAMAARAEAALAKHRAAAREIVCARCGCRFCPLHGAGGATLCAVCSQERERLRRRAHEARRKKKRAAEKAGTRRPNTPIADFGRDEIPLGGGPAATVAVRCEPPPPGTTRARLTDGAA